MILGLVGIAALVAITPDYTKDLTELIADLDQYGAYVRADHVDTKRMMEVYRPRLEAAKNRDEALAVFEDIIGDLHDFHASLGTNNDSSPKLVPSGTDFVAEWRKGKAIVVQVREGSEAEKRGITYGDELGMIGGKATREAAAAWIRTKSPTERDWEWALNSAIAGRWNVPREFSFRKATMLVKVNLATFRGPKHDHALTVNVRKDGIVYLRPENSLGEDELVREMDKAVPAMRKAKGIILDLRNTPSGGNSNVARGMMGLFISKRMPFQRHRVEEHNTNTVRDWVEYATPRLAKPISARLVVLVGRWTSSMGEGIAIGLDGMHRGTVVGTKMACLRGAVDSVELPSLGTRAFFPTEQVFHIDGTPRHLWQPKVQVIPTSPDAWMKKALTILRS